jgi:hypothetical protein
MNSKRQADRDLNKTSPSQLALLMGLNTTESLWSEADHAAMIRHLLDSLIPEFPAQTFGQLLASQHPDLATLRHVKEFAKSCRTDPDRGIPQDIATALYYAAIAAAQLRCGQSISQLSPVELRDGISWALARPWLPEALKHLFQPAERVIQG